jgi:hypothetical protein
MSLGVEWRSIATGLQYDLGEPFVMSRKSAPRSMQAQIFYSSIELIAAAFVASRNTMGVSVNAEGSAREAAISK